MTTHQRKLWPYLLSFILLSAVGATLIAGLDNLYRYKNSAQLNLPVNLATLRFFTKEYTQRQLQKQQVKDLPKNSSLPSFYFYLADQDLSKLEENLPQSAKAQYISGHMYVDNPELRNEVMFRYRGGLPLHWLYDKKSIRVKLPAFATFNGSKTFNLVNPSTLATLTDWISYEMSKQLGILTPDYFPARVFINQKTNGLHFYLDQVDESLLRKNRRMPGSIYSGDTLNVPNPFGSSKAGTNETVFKNADGASLMWDDPRLWQKDSSRNAESRADRRDIETFVSIINDQNPHSFYKNFNHYFAKEKFYAFWGLDVLVGSYHHDNFHNHKLYFDPYRGKFEPIEWDLRFWSSIFPHKDLPINQLLKQVILNPVLEFERDRFTFNLIQRFTTESITNRIDEMAAILHAELEADPYRQNPDARYGRFEKNKEVPFGMAEFDQAVANLKLTYTTRRDYVLKLLEFSDAEYTLEKTGSDEALLTVSVTGNSPVLFNTKALISDNSPTSIHRIIDGQEINTPLATEFLYPGRKIEKGNAVGKVDNWSILAFGREKLSPAPLNYQYKIYGQGVNELLNVSTLPATNAVTNSSLTISRAEYNASTDNTASIHPWKITQHSTNNEQIVLHGEITVNTDKVYSEYQTVTIEKGTTIALAKNASLIFYGPVLAKGSPDKPIRFIRLDKQHAWGSIVIQGEKATNSKLEHIIVDGGSLTRQRLINYPGQLNIHDVSQFTLKHCLIKNNSTGDDALHVAYSQGEISHCVLQNTAFDAIDIDIGDVHIDNIHFANIGNDALDLMTSNVRAHAITVAGAGDKCFSIGENSDVTISNSKLRDCEIGIAVKDQSKAYIQNIQFEAIRSDAISLYRKNPRYARGGTIDGEKLSGINLSHISSDATSTNLLSDDSFTKN